MAEPYGQASGSTDITGVFRRLKASGSVDVDAIVLESAELSGSVDARLYLPMGATVTVRVSGSVDVDKRRMSWVELLRIAQRL